MIIGFDPRVLGYLPALAFDHAKILRRAHDRVKDKIDEPVIALQQGLTDPIVGLSMGETAELLAHLIRDVRKDLHTPDMRFVIGVMGVGGPGEQVAFRKAMAAPASMALIGMITFPSSTLRSSGAGLQPPLTSLTSTEANFLPQLRQTITSPSW